MEAAAIRVVAVDAHPLQIHLQLPIPKQVHPIPRRPQQRPQQRQGFEVQFVNEWKNYDPLDWA